MSQEGESNSSPLNGVKRLASTNSSSGSWIEGQDASIDDDLDSVFQWFAEKQICRGNPRSIYERAQEPRPVILQALMEVNANGPAISGLLKRRLSKC